MKIFKYRYQIKYGCVQGIVIASSRKYVKTILVANNIFNCRLNYPFDGRKLIIEEVPFEKSVVDFSWEE